MNEVCTCCGRTLHPDRIVMLELDQRTNEYHADGGVPAAQSQGWFAFGPACARKAIKAARAAAKGTS